MPKKPYETRAVNLTMLMFCSILLKLKYRNNFGFNLVLFTKTESIELYKPLFVKITLLSKLLQRRIQAYQFPVMESPYETLQISQ